MMESPFRSQVKAKDLRSQLRRRLEKVLLCSVPEILEGVARRNLNQME